MKLVCLLTLLISSVALAQPFQKSKNSPVVEDPQMPGTPVPVETLNTAPAPTPAENESEKFRGTLHTGKIKVKPEVKKDKKNPGSDK